MRIILTENTLLFTLFSVTEHLNFIISRSRMIRRIQEDGTE